MVHRTRFSTANCPVARALDAIGDWWTLLIVREAFDGARKFGEFQRRLGVSKGILATRLRELVDKGIFELMPSAQGGSRSEYFLTSRGHDLFPVIVTLRQWGEANCFEPAERHSVLIDQQGKLVPRLDVRSRNGERLDARNTQVRKVD